MRGLARFSLVLCFLLSLQVPIISSYASAEPYSNVVLIIIDGVNPSSLQQASTPNLDLLMETGSYTFDSCSEIPTNTKSVLPAIYTGATQDVHQIYDWEQMLQAESLVTVLREAQYSTAVVGFSEHLGLQSTLFHEFETTHNNVEIFIAQAIEWLYKYDPFFTIIYVGTPDGYGHEFGHLHEDYIWALEDSDYQVGRIMQAYQNMGVFDDTLFVVTTDHSMVGNSHSFGPTFSILKGPNIKEGYEMGVTHEYIDDYGWVSHSPDDIAPTILDLMGLRELGDATGSSFADEIYTSEPSTPISDLYENDGYISIKPQSVNGSISNDPNRLSIIPVEVLISNVTEFDAYEWSISYDEKILELIHMEYDPKVLEQVTKITVMGIHNSFERPFTGSGVFVRYYFRPLKLGVSPFRIFNVKWRDDAGNWGGAFVSGCLIRVVNTTGPSEEISTMPDEYHELNNSYWSLLDTVEELSEEIEYLTGVNKERESLILSLTEDYNRFRENNDALNRTVAELEDKLSNTSSISGFSGVSVLLGLISLIVISSALNREKYNLI